MIPYQIDGFEAKYISLSDPEGPDNGRVAHLSGSFLISPTPFGCPIHADSFIVGMGGNENARGAYPRKTDLPLDTPRIITTSKKTARPRAGRFLRVCTLSMDNVQQGSTAKSNVLPTLAEIGGGAGWNIS